MIKKIFSALIVLAAMVQLAPSLALADSQPQVYVRNIALSRTDFSAGDTVTGTFSLINGQAGTNVPDIMYRISLAGSYGKDGLPQVYFDTKSFGPVFLSSNGQSKTVQFSYQLPLAFDPKDLGIHIQAYEKTGAPLGWSDVRITVNHAESYATVTKAVIMADTEQSTTQQSFSLMAGPTIHKDKQGSVNVTLKNDTKTSFSLTPHIVIHDRSADGQIKKNYDLTAVIIGAGKSQDVSFPLDTFNYAPGVYLGQVSFLDAEGVSRALPLEFRYIVAGDIVTVTSVTSTASSVKKGDILSLTANYAGAPYDIATAQASGITKADFSFKVYNERNQLVGENSQTIDLSNGNSKVIPITSNVDAKALRVSVVVSNAGKTVASYSANLSPDYDQARLDASHTPSGDSSAVAVGIAEVVIAIILILLVIKFMNPKKGSKMAILLAVALGGLFLGNHRAQAATITDGHEVQAVWDYSTGAPWMQYSPGVYDPAQGNGNVGSCGQGCINAGYHPFGGSTFPWYHYASTAGSLKPDVRINYPGDTDILTPGQQFYFQGTATAPACDNNPQDILVSATYNGQTITQRYTNTNGYVNSNNHNIVQGSTNFSIGPFTASATPGTSQITFRVDNFTNVPGQIINAQQRMAAAQQATPATPDTTGGDVEGFQNVVVGPNAQLQAASASSVCVSGNPNVAFSWTPDPAASGYEIHVTDTGTLDNWGWMTNVAGTPQTYSDFSSFAPWNNPGYSNASGVLQLISGKTYNYVVGYKKTNQATKYTPLASFVAATCNMAAPTVRTYCDSNNNSAVDLSWLGYGIGSGGSGGYVVHIADGNDNLQNYGWDKVPSPSAATSQTYTDFNGFSPWGATPSGEPNLVFKPNTTYHTVVKYNQTGQYSPLATFTTVTCVPSVPQVSLTASPSTVNSGNNYQTTLAWSSNNATSCTRSGPSGTGFSATNGASNGSMLATLPSTAGPYSFSVTCAGAGGTSAPQNATVTVQQTLTASCQPALTGNTSTGNDVNIVVNKPSVTWTALSSDPGATYSWSGSDITGAPTGSTLQMTYTTVGKKTASVMVTSADKTQHVPANCSANVNVKPDPNIREI